MMMVLEFALDQVRYAVPATRVHEIALRVLITPLPEVAPPVAGVIRWRGALTAVVELRARLGHSARPPSIDEHFVVAQAATRPVVLVVDRVCGLYALDEAAIEPPPSPTAHVSGIASLPSGLLLIQDLDAVLSPSEELSVARGIESLEVAR